MIHLYIYKGGGTQTWGVPPWKILTVYNMLSAWLLLILFSSQQTPQNLYSVKVVSLYKFLTVYNMPLIWLKNVLNQVNTKHFVPCKKASILRNLAEFRYSVKFVSREPISSEGTCNILVRKNSFFSYSVAWIIQTLI